MPFANSLRVSASRGIPVSSRITVAGPPVDGMEEILTPAALTFLADLHDRFAPRRNKLLALRQVRRDAVAVGDPLDFLQQTSDIRAGDWKVAPVPAYLADRRVEHLDRDLVLRRSAATRAFDGG